LVKAQIFSSWLERLAWSRYIFS